MDQPFVWESSSRTDDGMVRDHNEDACLDRPEAGIWAVADGMGGHAAGDLASGALVEALGELDPPESLSAFVEEVEDRMLAVNTRMREMASREEVHTIGSTIVALLIRGRYCVCMWAGDSRLYRYRRGKLEQLTQDHALVEELVEKGVLTPEEAVGHPQSNLVTRAVGATDILHIDAEIYELAHKDKFVLCSDGLDKEVDDVKITAFVKGEEIGNLSNALVDVALASGARDNVTVVAVQVFDPNADDEDDEEEVGESTVAMDAADITVTMHGEAESDAPSDDDDPDLDATVPAFKREE